MFGMTAYKKKQQLTTARLTSGSCAGPGGCPALVCGCSALDPWPPCPAARTLWSAGRSFDVTSPLAWSGTGEKKPYFRFCFLQRVMQDFKLIWKCRKTQFINLLICKRQVKRILLILMGASLYFIHICLTCFLQTTLFIFFSAPNQPGYLILIKTLIQTNPVLIGLPICLLQPHRFTSHISAEGELSGAHCMRMRCQRDIWGLCITS